MVERTASARWAGLPFLGALLLASLVMWFGKVAALLTADAPGVVFWVGFAAAAVSGASAVALLRTLVGEDKKMTIRRRARRTFLVALAFTVASGWPFLLDFYAAAAHETPKQATALVFAVCAFVSGALILGSVRALALAALRFAKLRGSVLPYIVFAAFEFSTLAFAPLVYFSALPAPVPVARPWFEGEARRMTEAQRGKSALVVFVDPRTSDADRERLSKLPPEDVGDGLAAHVRTSIAASLGTAPWARLVVMFPETFLNMDPSAFRALRPRLADGLRALVQPGADVEAWMGARAGDANVILRGFDDPVFLQPRGGIVRAKEGFVPFFEVPVAGFSLRTGDVSIALPDAGDESLTQKSGSSLAFGVDESQLALVCYEALSPLRWKFGGDTLVLTNHEPFAAPGLASAIYDHTLRLMARVFDASVFLVANKGAAGVYGEPRFARGVEPLAFTRVEGTGIR